MKLDRVTITGADDSIDPEQLLVLSREFPFVEWGILFSHKQQGVARFPTHDWISRLSSELDSAKQDIKLCAHLCGTHWVRNFVMSGVFLFSDFYQDIWPIIHRVQLNFHAQKHKVCPEAIKRINNSGRQFIVQYDGVNDNALTDLLTGNSIVPLFDTSGGIGILPDKWPVPIREYCGYAGGLGPDNIVEQLDKIEEVAGDNRIWIDMETKVRSDDNRVLDLARVRKILEITSKYISK